MFLRNKILTSPKKVSQTTRLVSKQKENNFFFNPLDKKSSGLNPSTCFYSSGSHKKTIGSKKTMLFGALGASMLAGLWLHSRYGTQDTENEGSPFLGNIGNRKFYNRIISSGELESYTQQAGLNTNADVKVIAQYFNLKKFNNILLSGAGYGRVPTTLTKHYGLDESNLNLLEISPNGVKILREKFPKAKVLAKDIMTLRERNCYDLICLLFSGITDFSQAEQVKLIYIFLLALTQRGYLIIDLPLGETNATDVAGKQHVIRLTKDISYTGYLPTLNEFTSYFNQVGKDLGIELEVLALSYNTDSQRSRALIVASKSPIFLATEDAIDDECTSRIIYNKRFNP